jgi:hypothetical protein
MLKILLSFCFIFIASYASAQENMTETEYIDYINSLSSEQLYDYFTVTTMQTIITTATDTDKKLFYSNLEVMDDCVVSNLRSNFNANDIRNILLGQTNTDKSYYINKVKVFNEQFGTCFYNNVNR